MLLYQSLPFPSASAITLADASLLLAASPGYFFLNKITSELPSPEKLLGRAAETKPSPFAALSPLLKAWLFSEAAAGWRLSSPSAWDSPCPQVSG